MTFAIGLASCLYNADPISDASERFLTAAENAIEAADRGELVPLDFEEIIMRGKQAKLAQ